MVAQFFKLMLAKEIKKKKRKLKTRKKNPRKLKSNMRVFTKKSEDKFRKQGRQ